MIHRKTTSHAHLSETKRLLYFAYGSNLNREQLHHRCPDAKPLCPAYLAGYRLAERKFADIEKDADSVVHGALYSITPADLESLDIYEGYPDGYTRKPIPATQENGLIRTAWVYMMTPEYRNNLDGQPYSAAYRKNCSDGAVSWDIPDAFSGKGPEGAFRYQTLFPEKIVSTAEALKKLAMHLHSGKGCLRAPVCWNGAGTAIARKRPATLPLEEFYGPPLYVITPHARELSWLYGELRDAFHAEKRLDGCSKIVFFERLSRTVLHAIEENGRISAEELCSRTLDEAYRMYAEMQTGTFPQKNSQI